MENSEEKKDHNINGIETRRYEEPILSKSQEENLKDTSVPFSSRGQRTKKSSGFSRLLFILAFLFLNAAFVLASVDFLLERKYKGSTIENVQPIEVVDEQSEVIEVAEKASASVVSIIATAEVPNYETLYRDFFNFRIPSQVQNGTEEAQIGAGSGFIVSGDGYIITNRHVVEQEDAKYTVILKNERNLDEKVEAVVIARDPNNDIAVLKIEKADLPFLDLGNSESLRVGQTTIAIGYALGEFDNTVSKGIISGLSRSIYASGSQRGGESLDNLIQTDAAVNPGNSGGPLLDIRGNVIGVNVAMADAQSIGFAIPINDVKSAYEQAKTSGNIRRETRAYLGVRYTEITSSVQKANNLPYSYGAIITRGESLSDLAVIPGSPADKAGLVENDIILEVNGEKVGSKTSFAKLIAKFKPGETVKLKIYHRGEEKEMSVTLGESS